MMYKFHQGQSWPCMHFVRIECDSVDPVEKLTHGSRQLFAKVDFGLPRADFLSRVDLDLQASRMFRTTPRKKIWCNFVQSCFVRTLAYGTWLRSLINAPCLPGVDSGDPVRKQTRHHVACTAREGTLLWILAKLLVHALCLDWGRFGRSGQKTNTASCSTCSS